MRFNDRDGLERQNTDFANFTDKTNRDKRRARETKGGGTAMELEKETYAIIGAAIEVHSVLGPGYLEGVYHEAMEVELDLRDLPFITEPLLEIDYKGRTLKKHYKPDFVMLDAVVVELKAHSTPLSKADQKQILNSLTCCKRKVGLLINFGRESLEWKRFVN
jgi:GxxExxY protein